MLQETRRWDDNKEYSYAMRSKEDAQDYRYFPEPDLVPIVISDEWIDKDKSSAAGIRDEKLARYKEEFDIPEYDAEIITESKHMADIFEADNSNLWKAEESIQLAYGRDNASVKRKWMEPEDIHSHLKILQN